MDSIHVTQINSEGLREIIRQELANALSLHQSEEAKDEIGKGAKFAAEITGKAIPTIYDLVNKRLIPHSKQGGDLYFSRTELVEWIKSGKRKTQADLKAEAENYKHRGEI